MSRFLTVHEVGAVPSLQVRSVMPSIWWLLVLLVRRGGMTERMTAAAPKPLGNELLALAT